MNTGKGNSRNVMRNYYTCAKKEVKRYNYSR